MTTAGLAAGCWGRAGAMSHAATKFLVWAFGEHARILRVTLSNRLQYVKNQKEPLFYFLEEEECVLLQPFPNHKTSRAGMIPSYPINPTACGS